MQWFCFIYKNGLTVTTGKWMIIIYKRPVLSKRKYSIEIIVLLVSSVVVKELFCWFSTCWMIYWIESIFSTFFLFYSFTICCPYNWTSTLIISKSLQLLQIKRTHFYLWLSSLVISTIHYLWLVLHLWTVALHSGMNLCLEREEIECARIN